MTQTIQGAEANGRPSFDDRRALVQRALVPGWPDVSCCGEMPWVTEITETDAVVCKAGVNLRYPYTLAADGASVTLGDPVPVRLNWQDVAAGDTVTAQEPDDGCRAFVTDLRGLTFSDSGPAQIEVCRDGEWDHPRWGKIRVTRDLRDSFVRNFQENVRKVGDLPLDYNHEDGPAPGWIKGLQNVGTSLMADVAFTPSGREKVQNGEYRFFSPEYHPAWKDPESGKDHGPTLFGGALTNKPFFRGMAAIQCSEQTGPVAQKEELMSTTTAQEPAIQTGQEPATVDVQKFKEMEDRVTAVEVENATLRAKEIRSGLTMRFTEMRFGELKRTRISPASQTALVDALVDVKPEVREKVIDAINSLQFTELGERGITVTDDADGETLTASEEEQIRGMAERNGLKFEEVKATFIENKRKRRKAVA